MFEIQFTTPEGVASTIRVPRFSYPLAQLGSLVELSINHLGTNVRTTVVGRVIFEF